MTVAFSHDENTVDVEGYRKRLQRLNEADLQREIQAGEYMCSPGANFGKPPREPFVIQLQEAIAELERRAIKSDGA